MGRVSILEQHTCAKAHIQPWGEHDMDRLTYGIRTAAEAASVSEHAIKVAIREGALTTRTYGENRVILHTDLQEWLLTSGVPVLV